MRLDMKGEPVASGIREVSVSEDSDGVTTHVRVVFGPHSFIEVQRRVEGGVDFVLGATHHGFRAAASVPWGELERIIYEVREAHPDLTVD